MKNGKVNEAEVELAGNRQQPVECKKILKFHNRENRRR